MSKLKPLIMISTGGTGGHVLSGLAVAKCLTDQSAEVVWVGTEVGLEATLVPAAGIPFETLKIQGFRGKHWSSLFLLPYRLSFALLRAMYLIYKYKPNLVLNMGGFVAAPAGLIAAAFGVPLVIHEQNTIAGITNRWLARFGQRILLGFPKTFVSQSKNQPAKQYAGEYVGNPVREEISALSKPQIRLSDRSGAIRLLVIGGSQGSATFNRVVPAALAKMPPEIRPQVKHQTGKNKLHDTYHEMQRNKVEMELFEFCDEMSCLYAWADLVLCRAGALSVAELIAVGIAAILVPYPFSVDGHQHTNAQYLAEAGAAYVVEEDHFTPIKLAGLLQRFSETRGELLKMAKAARRLACPQAAQNIGRICLEEMRT